jgi:hypothetical protein
MAEKHVNRLTSLNFPISVLIEASHKSSAKQTFRVEYKRQWCLTKENETVLTPMDTLSPKNDNAPEQKSNLIRGTQMARRDGSGLD